MSEEPNRLLIVDDDPVMASIMGKVARREGFDVIVTDEPGDLRGHVRNWGPTTIILDLLMPGLDGFEALAILKEEACPARLLVVSGLGHQLAEMARRIATDYGLSVAGILDKPFELAELGGILRSLLREGEGVNAGSLLRALAQNEIYLEYQPKVALPSLRPIGVEALLRWRHPQFGLLPPASFLPFLEQPDLTRALGTWLIDTGLRQKSAWRKSGIDLDMALNFSARDFGILDIGGEIERSCRELGMPVSGITLEITEVAAAANPTRIINFVERFKGIQIAIDDLGTGYSSLVQLKQLPFSEVKIDQYFVRDCLHSAESMIMVRSIIDLAHKLGQRVVAEGVEKREILDALSAAGCDSAQGYVISRAMPADRLPLWLAHWQAELVAS